MHQDKPTMTRGASSAMYEQVAKRLRDGAVFDDVRWDDEALSCRARFVESETYYRVFMDREKPVVWVGLYSPDRWLSESIEADLMHLGDKIEELLEEELVDQGLDFQLPIEHFRDEEMQYVFRSPVDLSSDESLSGQATVDRITRVLRAYEAAFGQLGDMKPSDE